ncbi:MAG TPA: hypothetical protein VFJ43_08745 [Bacteroidia bacterium]|nr:hypothetical protein [Bacteroidia bacterium]
MDPTISVAIIGATASILIAALTFFFTKKSERKDALQQRKLERYQELLGAISDLAIDDVDKVDANLRFAKSVNTIVLVAPQKLINALMEFHDEVKFSNPNKSQGGHDNKLRNLILEMRKSLELPFDDDPKKFNFHLVGSKPKQHK